MLEKYVLYTSELSMSAHEPPRLTLHTDSTMQCTQLFQHSTSSADLDPSGPYGLMRQTSQASSISMASRHSGVIGVIAIIAIIAQ